MPRVVRTTAALVATTTVALGIALLRAQQASSPPPDRQTFRGGVNLVQISVVATGADGQPVHGLTKDDFTVIDRGAARPIEGFAEISSPRPPASPFPATLAKDVGDNVTAKSDRVVILVLDDLHLSKVTDEI